MRLKARVAAGAAIGIAAAETGAMRTFLLHVRIVDCVNLLRSMFTTLFDFCILIYFSLIIIINMRVLRGFGVLGYLKYLLSWGFWGRG